MAIRLVVLVCTLTVATVALPPLSSADDTTEQRLRALELQLQQALRQLGEQRDATRRAQEEIGELKREIKQQRVQASPEGGGGAAARRAPTGLVATPELDRKIEQKVQEEVTRSQGETRQQQAQLETKVDQMKPAWADYARRFLDKFKIGTLVYGDWAFYARTGFGPPFLTQINPPGPGNDNYNSFDITRAYLNFYFMPDKDFTLRVTPNIFRAVGTASSDKQGATGAVGTNLDGNLTYRLKYAYIDWNTPFAKLADYVPAVAPMADAKITFGQQANPLIDWEETLYGYRFTSLTPWNYLSLSSTQLGLASKGPIKFGGLQYVDYDIGIYDNANFHQAEQSAAKQGMVRASVYPFGARSRFDGLGVTGFYDYASPNKTPDSGTIATHISRAAALLHYTTDWWGIAGEYDQGHNAFTSSNFFAGSGPADQFGLGVTPYAGFDAMVKALQDNDHTDQQGVDVFGHVDIPTTPFSVFGMYQWFLPNTQVSKNPLDFNRFVLGVAYKYNSYLRFALNTQYLGFYHPQFTFPASKQFGLKSAVPNAVPNDILAVFMNVEFNY